LEVVVTCCCRNLSSGSTFVELLNNEPHLMVADFEPVSQDDVITWRTEQVDVRAFRYTL